MRSPKFKYTLEHLEGCISPPRIRGSWKKKILPQLRKQIIIDLIEYRDYSQKIELTAANICSEISSGEYHTSPTRHYLIEKSRGLCRQMTLGAPRDLIVLQCLSDKLHSQIKASQPTENAFFEPGQGEFNRKRSFIRPSEYSSIASWKRFQQAIFNFSKERNYIVVTDIANFYDFININHLRNIVSSICDVSESIVDFLVYILDALAWHPDFMPTTGIGLPQMEIEAPRVLANAMLFELDRVAVDHSFGDYVRFMDDIDVGVDTLPHAKRVVRDIDLTLQSRQLRLNSSKTKILRTSNGEAADHFCIRENAFLDACAELIERDTNASLAIARRALLRAYGIWRTPSFEEGRFFRGNGEKIFKYYAALIQKCGENVPAADCLWAIQNAPNLRQTCFSALARNKFPNREFYKIVNMLRFGVFVDDLSIVMMANFLIHGRFINNSRFKAHVDYVVELLVGSNKYFWIHAAFVILSKYGTPEKIVEVTERTSNVWARDLWMGRVVGGLTPIVHGESVAEAKYLQVCRRTNNAEWESVYEYHYNLRTKTSFKDVSAYLKSDNPTFAHGIFHPKTLTMLSLHQNPHPSAKALIADVRKRHTALRQDPIYFKWFAP